MQVNIVTFPETRVAVISHIGPPWLENETVLKLVEWKLQNGLRDQTRYRNYGLHYTDPRKVNPAEHRVDFCVSIDRDIGSNAYSIFEKVIPSLKCALARDIGSRTDNQAAKYLFDTWLPYSGETMADYPIIFHYVNVGPNVKESEAITDVYLPLK